MNSENLMELSRLVNSLWLLDRYTYYDKIITYLKVELRFLLVFLNENLGLTSLDNCKHVVTNFDVRYQRNILFTRTPSSGNRLFSSSDLMKILITSLYLTVEQQKQK